MSTLFNVLTSAQTHHQAGRLRAAEQIYRQVLEQDPDSSDATHYLGLCYHQMGRKEEALEFMKKSIEMAPENADYIRNLGNVFNEMGEWDDAISHYERAYKLAPDAAETHNNLASVYTRLGRHEEALKSCREAVRIQPNYAKAHFNLGNTLCALEQYTEAREAYQQALEVDANFTPALRRLGDLNRQQMNLGDAVGHYQKALAAAWQRRVANRATADAKSAEEVTDLCERILQVDRNNLNAINILANLAVQELRHEDARDLYLRALKAHPNAPAVHHGIASTYVVMGDFDKATEHFRAAIKLNPKCAEHYFNFAAARKFTKEDKEIEVLETLLAASEWNAQERAFGHYAAGKIYDDLGEYDQAFKHYRNGAVAKMAIYDSDQHHRLVTETIKTVSREVIEELAQHGSDSEVPIFVVGTPRSGTTLTEQTLCSHPDVFGAGELSLISKSVVEAPGRSEKALGYPKCFPFIKPEAIERWAAAYLKEIREMDGEAVRIVDKAPLNFLYLGFIAALFPNARIIHCRRDPLDSCLSCYFHKFRDGHEYSYSLTNVGFFNHMYRRLMAHWREELPMKMYELDYEIMINDQEGEIRKLLEFCDLPWHDGCLEYHKHKRAVFTASNWQVRHGIDKSRMKRWEKYEEHIGPLKEALRLEEDELYLNRLKDLEG